MALLTVTNLKLRVETDLDTVTLQDLLDDAEAEIVKRFGAHGDSDSTITEDHEGGGLYIFPSRPVSSFASVIEREDNTDTTLSSDDYRIMHGGLTIQRLDNGTNEADEWAAEVRIVYQATTELDSRKRVQADLVRLAIEYRGLRSESVGDHSQGFVDYQAERNKILSALQTGRLFV